MKFDETNKVIIDTMDRSEAKAFIKFLQSEIARHQMDIDNANALILEVSLRFGISFALNEDYDLLTND